MELSRSCPLTDFGISGDELFGSLYANLLINCYRKNKQMTYLNSFFKNGLGSDTAKLKLRA
jgi:hypothetical protein